MQPYQENLTRRQSELLVALMDGCTSYSELGARLCITHSTVKAYLLIIYKMTGAKDKAALVLWWVKNGYKAT